MKTVSSTVVPESGAFRWTVYEYGEFSFGGLEATREEAEAKAAEYRSKASALRMLGYGFGG